jgi:GTPase SAR1 family protein
MDPLRSYSHLKLALAGQVRLLRALLQRGGNANRKHQCEELMVKLAEDRFTLAVLGQFTRGKTSLMNAIIGRDLLPTGPLPLTSAITVLRFGPTERLVIERHNSGFTEVAPLSRLEDYITERGNPGNRKMIKSARVELPLPFLRRGLEFVDTPGVGSVIAANTATTYSFLPMCDAILFVTSVDTPLTGAELDFLADIRRHAGKIFFVVNKTDLLGDHDCREVLDFIVRTLRQHLGTDPGLIFPISCRLGLAAKRQGDTAAYARSGLEALEDALSRFLSEEKTATLLAAVVDRAIRLLAAEAGEIDLHRRARALPEGTRAERLNRLRALLQAHETGRRAIFSKLRRHILEQAQGAIQAEVRAFTASWSDRLERELGRPLDHCSWQPCAVTSRRITEHTRHRMRRSVSRWLGSRRHEWRFGSDSFCQRHWQEIEANLTRIPERAADALGLDPPDPATADLPRPWPGVDPDFQQALSLPPEPRTRLPAWLRPLPARPARRWLQHGVRAQHAQLLESYPAQLAASLASQVGEALDTLWDDVSTRAAGIESRLLAAITDRCPETSTRSQDADGIRHNLLALRAEILRLPAVPPATPDPEPPATTPTFVRPDMPAADRARPELLNDLRTRGCPVCDHLLRVAFKFFAHWQYALSSQATAQREFAAELGFCPLHTWQLEAIASPVGSSAGYVLFVQRLSRLLGEAAASPAEAGRMVQAILRDAHTCRVCRLLRDVERHYATGLAALVAQPPGRKAYARAQGVCLHHLAVVAAESDPETGRFLLAEAARRFEELAEDMQTCAMKTESLRRALSNQDEEDAYLRAVTHIVGARGVSVAHEEDVET